MIQPPYSLSIEDYNYELPEERIAKYPLEHRDASKLLYYRAGEIEEHSFASLPQLLPEDSLLVRNDSRVIRARLLFKRETGAVVEIFCLDPADPASYEASLGATESCAWHCLLGNARRWKQGETLSLSLPSSERPDRHGVILKAKRGEGDIVQFAWDNAQYSFGELLEGLGILPIPPYLNRPTEHRDLESYQTTYARHSGSVAAPTAGLHFTPEVFASLQARGIPTLDVTLHVGAGTFRPVKSETIGEHSMHQELVVVSRAVVEALCATDRRIIAVGTTSVRTLESLYNIGRQLLQGDSVEPEKLSVSQWQAYEAGEEMPSSQASLEAVCSYMDRHELESLCFPTAILIAPGYRFGLVRGLVTNFHQPRSTLLLLIAALLGERWREVYDYALRNGFRFLSYGDSSLLLP